MIHCEDYDITQDDDYSYREDWIHVDDLPDFDEIRGRLLALSKMVEGNASKSDILMLIDEITLMI